MYNDRITNGSWAINNHRHIGTEKDSSNGYSSTATEQHQDAQGYDSPAAWSVGDLTPLAANRKQLRDKHLFCHLHSYI